MKIKFFKISKICLFLFLASLNFNYSLANEFEERIKNFSVEYKINSDGSIEVKEEITIVSNQDKFKHGIYREFFTNKVNKNYFPQEYIVYEAKLNDAVTNFTTSSNNNKFRLKVGNPDILLSNGEHKFVIKYKIENISAYFADHDEIFINLIGQWEVPIENFNGSIELANSIDSPKVVIKGFQGIFGSNQEFSSYSKNKNLISFNSERVLDSNENISIALWFPKGTFPNKYDSIKTIEDRYIQAFLLVILLMPIITILISYKKSYLDSKIKNPVVVYDIPKEITPSIFRYLDKRKIDDKSITSELIYLVFNKYIKISQNQINNFIEIDFLNKDTSNLFNQSFYQGILFTLFSNNQNKFILNKDTNRVTKISSLIPDFKNSIRSEKLEYSDDSRNFFEIFLTFLCLASMIGLIIYLTLINNFQTLPFFLFFIFILLFSRIFNKLIVYKIFDGIWNTLPSFIYIGIITTLFLFLFLENVELMPRIFFIVSYFLYFYNDYLTIYSNRYTQKGLEYLAIIKGFKKFALSQSSYLKGFNSEIPLSLSMYESYLPYALALDIETEWSKKFHSILSQISDQNSKSENFALYSYSLIGSSVTSNIDSNVFYTSFGSNSEGKGSTSSGFSSDSSSGSGGGSAGGGGW